MIREYSIAMARDHFTAIVRQAEAGDEVRLTRRGRPVAVVLSEPDFQRLSGALPSIVAAAADLREEARQAGIDYPDEFIDGLRDRSPGRQVEL
jgi:prevent-host-death family protein